MREDKLEVIDSMFPNGYILVYPDVNAELRLTLSNPTKDKALHEIYKAVMEVSENWNP